VNWVAIMKISIASDYSPTPGGRYRRLGPFSGEEFRERVLLPAARKAFDRGEVLIIDFDGVVGAPSSFLEEAFGGLARELALPAKELGARLTFEATDKSLLPYVALAKRYMDEAASSMPA
jgi:hypothetical protein